MTTKERIKALEEYITTFSNNDRHGHMYFCLMPCMIGLTHKQKLKELKRFRLLEACEDCDGEYTIYSDGISAFMKLSLYFSKNMKVYREAYNEWKIEIAKRAIELLAE